MKQTPKIEESSEPQSKGKVRNFFANLGPGVITGAADDDPSGISTYSVTGAAFGLLPLWTALFSFPLMASVQLMCANLGLVTGRGLASVIRENYSRSVLWGACLLLIVANVFNIGADLGGMAEATEMMIGVKSYYLTPVYALLIVALLFFTSYKQIARIFKWLTLVLFAYVITAFLARPDWIAVLKATLIPQVEWSSDFLATFVGILGTTISPYLFFWQAANEVEDKKARGKSTDKNSADEKNTDKNSTAKQNADKNSADETPADCTDEELRSARTDVLTGMFFSNLVMFFIILTTATTLHANGQTQIETAKDAAEALRPLAGDAAYLLFTLGLVGTGLLAVPVLAGSAAYAISEAKNWRGSLEDRPRQSPGFYVVIGAAMLLGLALDFIGFNAVKMLFYSAVLNGILAPPLIVLVVLLTGSRKVMGKRTSSRPVRYLGWATAAIMFAASVGMLFTV